ncbi:hypothetical protein DLAC_10579 [Tieghemostelium lacteum]|uniref:Activator of Hsp90 ATPase homologue 1/2-like C-terminal domain-containing protein n=1 Tax=Tieghemostelium lacteum TaxID=361077 RepID=A0A151Z4Q8_TIELA|nr:hypothetical protein DLAC_10579 [Tieghemostelium lacteum]|eukprot:KYQ88784.1 hypothetical protein DLAC_10579 [Tieghemostelium lacteum]
MTTVVNYNNTILLNTSVDKVYKALTNEIPLWWTEMFEGSSDKQDVIFTVRFGDNVYKTMQVQELNHHKVVWYVKNSLIALPEFKNQTEWIGTTIVWEINEQEQNTKLILTHIGLNSEIECYQVCSNGWKQFIDSLKSYLENGKGTPFLIQN